ncbi:MAG: DUF1476 domain-containing protein [Pseudomonadota bacterium]
MTGFDDREQAFEKKFAHDAEMQFKAQARRDKLLGLWAAGQLGLSGAAADDYARELVMVDMEEAGDEDVYRKVAGDFEAKGISTDGLRETMARLLAEAKAQVMGDAD